MRGHTKGRHAFHEASRKPTQPTIAQCSIRFQCTDALEVDVYAGQRLARHIEQAQIAETVGKQAADEKFQREVIDPLLALTVTLPGTVHPLVDHAVTRGQRHRLEPVMVGGMLGVLADRVGQLADHVFPKSGDLVSVGSSRFLRHGQTSCSG